MQTMFRNPLAGPFVLGINSGASLGVALVVLTVGATGGTLAGWLWLTERPRHCGCRQLRVLGWFCF